MRIPEIQALRALAAFLVVIYHANLTSGGFIGVDIFYVISGFLITGLLLKELQGTGSLNLRAFYLFWPFIIFGLYKLGSRRAVFQGVLAITLSSFLLSLLLS